MDKTKLRTDVVDRAFLEQVVESSPLLPPGTRRQLVAFELSSGCPPGQNANSDLVAVAAEVRCRGHDSGAEEEDAHLSLHMVVKLNKLDETSFEHLIASYQREKG